MPLKKPQANAQVKYEFLDQEEDPTSSDNEDYDEEVEEESNSTFTPKDVLPASNYRKHCVEDLIDLMDSPYLEINPPYQRDVVWSTDRMIKLVNSLFSGYYIPPIIFNVISPVDTSDQTVYQRRVIDGKQRLTSIYKFVKGHIPCTGSDMRRWYFTDNPAVPSKTKKRIIPSSWCQKFLSSDLLVVEYADLVEGAEEDLFSRVQLGMPLTPAEKLKASSGKWQELAIMVEKEYPRPLVTIDNKRARGFQLIMQVLRQLATKDLEEDDPMKIKFSPGVAALSGFINRPQLLTPKVVAIVEEVFKTYTQLVEKYPDTFENHGYLHSTKFSPIEFVGVAVLIARFPKRVPGMLAGDVLKMREALREERQDLRTNTPTWRCLMDYLGRLELERGRQGESASGELAPEESAPEESAPEESEAGDLSNKRPAEGIDEGEGRGKRRSCRVA